MLTKTPKNKKNYTKNQEIGNQRNKNTQKNEKKEGTNETKKRKYQKN